MQGAARYVLGERDGKFEGKVISRLQQHIWEQCMAVVKVLPMTGSKAYLVGTRAAQAGGLTAAGYALAQLTTQFGGPADRPEPNQLSM